MNKCNMSVKDKIAVVTLYGEFNFGNRLQNYAIHKYMSKLGFNVETIVIKEQNTIKNNIFNMIKCICMKFLNQYVILKKPHWLREKKFKDFTKKYIRTRYINSKDGKFPESISNIYNHFIIGSDQVWNPTFGNFEKYYYNMFLLFTSPEKKICFSPSIGVTYIPEEWQKKFSDGFKTFPTISVREESAAKIVYELSGKNAEVLIDPTLMLNDDEWSEISKENLLNGEKYVFEYFLGEMDSDIEKNINNSEFGNFKRINILDSSNPDVYASGPAEFISMIKNAELVCTDSFHACVFSIIFDVPFIVKKRKDENRDMFSRIETLLRMFGINGTYGKVIYIDKNKKSEILRNQRTCVDKYIEKCIYGG